MTLKKTILLGSCLALVAGLSACGRIASSAAAPDYAVGDLNTGADKDEGTVNSGSDKNQGVVNDALTPNTDGVDVGGSSMRDADGKCINDKDDDNLCNEEDDDIDGDGIVNVKDKDIDGDGIANVDDTDMDGDGITNIDDNDMDGDGIANVNDTDTDGDGASNTMDDDMDGDGITNIDDNDMDGDGVANTEDDDVDGDAIVNEDDSDSDGDGVINENDNDSDGDGIANGSDDDMDGDGTANDADTDADGDGTANDADTDANGDGQNDSGVDVSEKLAYFSKTGSVSLDVQAGMQTGSGSQGMNFQDLRDSAADKNADVNTVTPYDITVKVDPATVVDPAVVALLQNFGATSYVMRVYYQLPGEAKMLMGRTPDGAANAVSDLVNGVSFDNNQLLPTKNYETFQGMFSKPAFTAATMVVELTLASAAPIDATVTLIYEVKANAKVNL